MKLGNVSVAAVIVAIVLILIIPVPDWLLDVLLAVNIAVSLIILLNTVYATDALQLSIFPSLLLITTIFRLSLNISASKLILGVGEPGQVIRAFGEFVTSGNMVVGFVIFLIITIVQFLVITRGAERVSEVAARFTLDAMPGKQMAIDADLNAGIINDEQAKERRRNIQREADFYGAMDGASKFVKNDAIASIIITVINLVGGLIIGMVMRGEPFETALGHYALVTVGNGLVNQIPALLVSTATGIIVTRAGADSNLSDEMLKQIFQNSRVMFIASGLSLMLSFSGLPMLPFMLLSGITAFIGFSLMNHEKAAQKKEEVQVEESQVEEIRKPENVVGLLHVDPIELEFGYGIIPLADVNQGGDLLDRVVMIRRQLALELGMIVPIIRLRDNIQLNPNEYVIKIKGVEVSRGSIMFDHYLAMNPGTVEEEIDGIPTTEPAFGLPAIWVADENRERAELLGYTVVDPPSIIATHLTEIIKRFAHELMGRQEIQTLVDNLKQNYPAVVEEVVPKLLTIGEVQKVLANLLKEGISIRDMVTIFETLADYAAVTRDTDLLTEYVRQALGRAITKSFFQDEKANVITLDPKLEQMIMEAVQKTDHGSYINMDPDTVQKMLGNLQKMIQKVTQLGQQPVVLSSPIVRLYFKRITEQAAPGLTVLSYNELDSGIEVQSVGMVSI